MVGRSREEVIAELTRRFGLASAAERRMGELGAASPEEAYGALRLRHYEQMLHDHDLVRSQEYPAATDLLRRVKAMGLATGLATMSYRYQVDEVLDVLGVRAMLDAVVARDDVARPKPDPEIYLLLARRLGVPPERCLVVEDSVPGIRSALAAGATCVAATTDLTRAAVHAFAAEGGALPAAARIVDDPARLAGVVLALLQGGGGDDGAGDARGPAAPAAGARPNEHGTPRASDA
jgi:HAD superfamily hydrolase (TIGR01509 family)